MMNENDKGADELPQYVVDLLKKVAENERIEGFVIDIRSGSSVGDGYLSNLKSVVMRGKRTSNNGDSVELHLLCKMLTDSERACEEMNLNDLFEREIFFYSVVFPALEKFQTSRGITSNAGFFAYPKCYETVFNSEQRQMALIMGDLRRSDFKMWPKQQPADIGHVELVFRQLAKFHGVSFAMKDQEPSTFNRLRSTELFSPLLEKKSFASYFDASHQKCIQGLEKTLAPARFERVKAIFANSRALLKKTCNGLQSEPYSVLIHGDSWSNNFLFRYEQSGCPAELRFIDWQFSNYNSPAVDIFFYLFSGTDKALRDKHYHRLIKLYHDTLSDTIQQLGSNANKLFPFDAMMENFKQFGVFTYLAMPITVDIVVASSDESTTFYEFPDADSEASNKDANQFQLGENTLNEYIRRMTDITNDLFDLGMITIE